jgi:DNA-binding LacI/PurR family transcriptional regulator
MVKDGAKIVFVDRTLENLRCPSVATDNVKVGRLATEHLISLGHRRIGHLRGDSSSVSAERHEGYREALLKRKLPYASALVRRCGFLESEGYEAMRSWLAEGGVPDAIFIVNDPAAIGAMRALDEAGLQAGKDVALVGAGNIHYGAMLRVPLTTVSWSKSEMGRSVARLLIELIEAKAPVARVQHVVLEPELLVRDSCGSKANKPSLRLASK